MVYPFEPAANDRDTSISAAEAMRGRANHIRARVYQELNREPMTVHECANAMGLAVPTVQPRFSELAKMELIADTGVRRVNVASGKRAIVWGVNHG